MLTRRSFLKKSSAVLAAGVMHSLFAPYEAAARKVGANDKIRVALIGCRNMGWSDLSDFMRHPEIDCVALCDIDQNILRNRAAEIEKSRSKRPEVYTDYRKLLDRQDVDIVIIGTPDHWHCLQMTDACSAGKDVYVEKPIANSIAECDAMVKAAERYGRVVQVGQQQRSGEHWAEMKRFIDGGTLGKISCVDVWGNFAYAALGKPVADTPVPEGVDFDMWLGPAPERTFNPQRFHGSWRMFWDYGGGLLTDWGVHLLDMALWGMNVTGMPKRVMATGGNFTYPQNYAETFDTLTVLYEFDDFTIQWSNVVVEGGPYGRNYGLEFVGTNGTLVANRESWEVYPVQNRTEPVKSMPNYQDHKDHVTNFLESMKTRNKNTACTVENGSLCAKYAHLGNISARVKEALVFDDEKKTFRHKAADELIKPDYRKPWKFPRVG